MAQEFRDTLGIRQLAPATNVAISYGTGTVEIESNGEIALIEINYNGAFKGVNRLGAGWTMKAGKSKVIIFSLAQSEITNVLFDYIGELEITSAKYVTWDEQYKTAQVNNLNKNDCNLANADWGSDARKYEEIETQKIIHKKIRKTTI